MPLITFNFDEKGEVVAEPHQPLTTEQWSLLAKFATNKYFHQWDADELVRAAERIKEYGI